MLVHGCLCRRGVSGRLCARKSPRSDTIQPIRLKAHKLNDVKNSKKLIQLSLTLSLGDGLSLLANLVARRRLGFIVVRDERFFGCFCADLFVALRLLELLDLRWVFVPLHTAASVKKNWSFRKFTRAGWPSKLTSSKLTKCVPQWLTIDVLVIVVSLVVIGVGVWIAP
jgi:hypothetical protein